MLTSEDKETSYNIQELIDITKEGSKPLLFWIGAGASCWNGYPLWSTLANEFVKVFSKKEANFNSEKANALLREQKLPELFCLCYDTNKNRYNELLIGKLKKRENSPVYTRFVAALSKCIPLHILTTNIDNCLEYSLKNTQIISRSNIERTIDLIQKKESFVVKLHGDLSDLNSVIFTSREYDNLLLESNYLEVLKILFAQCSVVFIGTSLGDEYVLNKIRETHDLREFLGSGPHFAVVKEVSFDLPDNLKIIKYTTEMKKDHRSSIQLLEEINSENKNIHNNLESKVFVNNIPLKSAHLLSTVNTPGTWRSSQSVTLNDGVLLIQGLGFVQEELNTNVSTALDDLITGLICFNTTYCSIDYAGQLFQYIGEDLFFKLIESEALKFLYWENLVSVIYKDKDTVHSGEIVDIQVMGQDKKNIQELDTVLRRVFKPNLSQLVAYEKLISKIIAATQVIVDKDEVSISKLTKDLLMRPSIKKLLGRSPATPKNSIPRWQCYPVLRLATTLKLGVAAEQMGICSLKLDFGCSDLAIPAFASLKMQDTASDVANYVFTGKHLTSAGRAIAEDPRLLFSVLDFRETQASISLRKEVFDIICANESSDIVTAINGGLRAALPGRILQEAADALAYLIPKNVITTGPAILKNSNFEKSSLTLWKERSRKELSMMLVGVQGLCPCGSQEPVVDCCLFSLKTD